MGQKISAARRAIDAQVGKGEDWRIAATESVRSLEGFAKDRNTIAHSRFYPRGGGEQESVLFRQAAKGKASSNKESIWEHDRFRKSFESMDKFRNRINRICGELRSVSDRLFIFTFHHNTTSPAAWMAQVEEEISRIGGEIFAINSTAAEYEDDLKLTELTVAFRSKDKLKDYVIWCYTEGGMDDDEISEVLDRIMEI